MNEKNLFALEIPVVVLLCILYSLASYSIHEYKRLYHTPPWCHESSIATILGILIGAILKFWTNETIKFDNEVFFYLVLPPIIFSAGYTLKRRNFFRYFHLISFFGIIGTILQLILLALLSSFFASYFVNPMITTENQKFSWKDGLLLSAILSGSDEVSAMSLIRMKDFPRMGALIFGEGVLNDALSIVIFKVLSEWIEKTDIPSSSVSDMMSLSFILSLFKTILFEILFSCLIGLSCGLLHARLLILLPSLRCHPIHQTSLLFLFGYLSYTLAELFSRHASSILSLLITAITLAHYSFYSLSKTSQLTTLIAFKSFADISEALSFSYLGLSFFSYHFTHYSLLYSLSLLLSLILIRLMIILFLFLFLQTKISFNEQIGFALGGMVRGSLCWAQVQYIQKTAHPILITTILMIVMCTTVGSGFILPILIPWLTEGIALKSDETEREEGDQGRGGGGGGRGRGGGGGGGGGDIENEEEKGQACGDVTLTQRTLNLSPYQAQEPLRHLRLEEQEEQESTYTTYLNNSVEDSFSLGD
jgi:solute carrier family 9 (sodium/hydrogen exchanger), member 8